MVIMQALRSRRRPCVESSIGGLPDALQDKLAPCSHALDWAWRCGADTANERFYADQFEKHGTCNINQLSAPKYFSAALQLHQRHAFHVRAHAPPGER